jgi:hypothetical protein
MMRGTWLASQTPRIKLNHTTGSKPVGYVATESRVQAKACSKFHG